jgi:hypothetical protein
VIRFIGGQDKSAIEQVAALYQRRLAGESITEDEWLDARKATYDAQATSDADTSVAAYATAAYAAIAVDAPGAVADAAFDAADADASVDAAYAADVDAARCAHFVRMSEKLLELLASAPVPTEI